MGNNVSLLNRDRISNWYGSNSWIYCQPYCFALLLNKRQPLCYGGVVMRTGPGTPTACLTKYASLAATQHINVSPLHQRAPLPPPTCFSTASTTPLHSPPSIPHCPTHVLLLRVSIVAGKAIRLDQLPHRAQRGGRLGCVAPLGHQRTRDVQAACAQSLGGFQSSAVVCLKG